MPVSILTAAEAPLREAALALLYHRLPHGERERQLEQTLAAVGRQELSLEHLLVAVDDGRIVGTALAVRRPGDAAFLWPPVTQAGAPAESIASALLETVGRRVDQQGVTFTQCLIDPADDCGKSALTRGGVPHVTDLILLTRPLPGARPESVEQGLTAASYTPETHNRFADIVERTYEGTLDCPALARIRSGAQMLESHRATGQFKPEACLIFQLHDRDIGILLLAEHPDRDLWEVAYMGVVPEARRRGFGRAILSRGIDLARTSGRTAMEIAVDVANAPALRLYASLGFSEVRRFAVHLRFRRPSMPGPAE
ncbi:MAG: GNAT family N-acetyltransferase [Planctomycetia bacterium]|nr:GNAT family N-acetyltransferase [Planctomycetia bacterium]